MNKVISIVVILVLLVGCGGEDSPNSTSIGNFTQEYYGKWIRVDTKEEVNILQSTVIDNHELDSENLIKVTKDDSSYYLMRAGLSNIVVNGKIVSDESILTRAKSPARIGNVNIILKNVLDENIKADIQTDDDGSFKTTSLPSGTYTLAIDDDTNKINRTIKISQPIEDIGTYKLTGENLYNFKAELILDDEFLYADELVHTGKIRIHNISNQVGFGLYYTININDGDLKSFNNDLVKGSIQPSEYMDIPIFVSFNQISENSKTIDIDVKINDVENKEWSDKFTFTLYKGYFSVNIATEEDSVKGYLVMPKTNEVKPIDIDGYGNIIVPLVSNDEYHLLLSNPSFENETAYSIGINKAADDFETFNQTSAHEPNNNESTASTIVLNSSIKSYLHAGDLDYWKISLPENESLFDFTLGNFTSARDVQLSQLVTSNNITITDKLTQGKEISISINNGSLVINGADTNTKTAIVKTNDTVAIKLQAPSKDSASTSSTLLVGQNSVIFTIYSIDSTAPIFTSPANFAVDENTLAVGSVKATDKNTIIYSIVDQNTSSFDIDANTGKISFRSKPNYESKSQYTLSVKATDLSNNSVTQNIIVKINDVLVELSRSSDGIVTDHETDYMWQDSYNSVIKKATQPSAKNYCKNLKLGNYSDWALPSSTQLQTIIDYEKSNPAVSLVFKNTKSSGYWTSTSVNSYRYYIDFSDGNRDTHYIAHVSDYNFYEHYVRCVRLGE